MINRLFKCLPQYVALAALVLAAPRRAAAQEPHVSVLDFPAGGEFEQYLRALQDAGVGASRQWSIRSFSRREIEALSAADTAGPWRIATRLQRASFEVGGLSLTAIENTAFPYGYNDGPLWAGKGLTVAAGGGVAGHLGGFSFAFAPTVFSAQNASFPLLANGLSGNQRFNHGTFASIVDLPQRFGDGTYSRVDLGQSYVRFDSHYVTAGASSANEWIGPAAEYPFILGNNAPGFPHLFLGTGDPVNLWIARVSARAMWGKLYQSDYSPVTGSARYESDAVTGTQRLAASATVVATPRGVPGLELGVARFFHIPYTESEPNSRFWKKPFEVLFLKNEIASGDTAGADNQLASVFFRWALPGSGFEFYGERGYEDQFYDLRELLQDLDHEREYMVGFQKVFSRSATSFDVIRGEAANYQLPTLARVREEDRIYVHSVLRQGHTNRGQLLGISAGVGAAAASTLSWTRYSTGGRTSFSLRRVVQDDIGNYEFTGVENPHGSDVIVALGGEKMRFGKHFDFGAHVELMDNFNRNFSSDVFNLNVRLTTRIHP